MVSGFDRIVLAVPDINDAVAQYRRLFGVPALPPGPGGAGTGWLALANTVIALEEAPVERAGIRGLVFTTPEGGAEDRPVPNAAGLDLATCDGSVSAAFRECADTLPPALRVDHVVLRTADAEASVGLFARQLGIRLALDRTVPEWGGRMLFFRAGKLTLEVIEPDSPPVQADHFWGIAYQCPDLEEEAARLRREGVDLSPVRPGRKPGTRVATVKSHCLGIPTLLIEPAT